MMIRSEKPGDYGAVRAVNEAAFETATEADLVECLRKNAGPLISLVAEEGGDIVGHILFSPMTMDDYPDARLMGLAPMAVLPGHQGRGIGSALVKAGLEACKALQIGAVFVLGHPGFYPRFGFVPASRFSIHSEYEVPDEVFMALELESAYLTTMQGQVRYHPVFQQFS